MIRRLIAGVLSVLVSPVLAQEAAPKPLSAAPLSAAALPSLALDPRTPESIWHGLYVGTDIVAVSRKGSKGFVGGDVTAGYDRVLDNNVIMGINAAIGIAPGFSAYGPIRGYDFASLGTRVGYSMGRWTPYVAGDLLLAKPNTRFSGSFSGMDSVNDLFNSSEKLEVGGRVAAGVDYALTNNLTVGVGVSVNRGVNALYP